MFHFFKPYKHLPGYIHRFSLFVCGRLHIRIHKIFTPDGTPYIHRHPFSYISIILKGGYIEQVARGEHIKEYNHKVGKVIIRGSNTYHRIKALHGPTITLFVAFAQGDWDLKVHEEIEKPSGFIIPEESGLYEREIGGMKEYAWFDGFWRRGSTFLGEAKKERRPSIHQVCEVFKKVG